MNRIQKVGAAFVVALFGMMSTASADPISDFFDKVLGVSSATAQPNVVRGSRRYHRTYEGHNVSSNSGHTVLASFYGHGEKLNKYTASGQVFNPYGLTAAHRSFPMGTRLLVSRNGRSIVVTINDRGPAAYTGRSLDLSYRAARQLGMGGVAPVQIARLN